jgi:hypothetical protein
VTTVNLVSRPDIVQRRHLAVPVAVGAGAVAAFALLRVRDPHVVGSYGFCPFHALTGLWCPACGGLRAASHIPHGDVVAAASSNVLLLPLLALAVVAWLRWIGGRPQSWPSGRVAIVFVSLSVLVFTVLRNTAWGEWLAPG